jgi:tetratricopeptide (TPR) repeat protein
MTQAPNPSLAIEAALAHHRAGRLAEAERLYQEILGRDPGDARALRNFGVLHLQRNDPARALPLLAAATAADPDNPDGWRGYVRALGQCGRFEAALQVLAAHVADPTANHELERGVRRAWAAALRRDDALALAEQQLLRVVALAPDEPDSHADLGVVQAMADRPHEAEASFNRALALRPDHPAALIFLGSTLNRLGRHEEALGLADRALALIPSGEAWIVRGEALRELGRDEAALSCFVEAGKWDARRFEALTKAARQHTTLGRYEQSLAAYDTAIALRPQDAEARFHRGVVRLTVGDFEGGWSDYEARLQWPAFVAGSAGGIRDLIAGLDPILRPDDLRGRRVLLVPEQGIGDQVMFASLIPDIAALASEITCVCEPRLVGLFSASFPDVRVVDPGSTTFRRSDFDKVVAMAAPARLFRGRLKDFPGRPYLAPRAAVRERWARTLGPRPAGLRIGVSWRGGVPTTNAARRTMTFEQLAPVLNLPDCEFVSLQYGEVEEEVAAASAKLGRPVRVFPKAQIDDFEELAGLLQTLDVVVSVQTAVAHLAGAHGKGCLVMLPYSPEWRYMAGSSAMPWYRSVELHRQPELGAWGPVLHEVTEALRARLGRTPA